MKVYNMPRSSGKTTFLMRWLSADPECRTVVVHNEDFAQHLRDLYGFSERPHRQIMSIGYAQANDKLLRDRMVVIDDLDLTLSEVLRFSPSAVFHTQSGHEDLS